jgi:hypothetical protein
VRGRNIVRHGIGLGGGGGGGGGYIEEQTNVLFFAFRQTNFEIWCHSPQVILLELLNCVTKSRLSKRSVQVITDQSLMQKKR